MQSPKKKMKNKSSKKEKKKKKPLKNKPTNLCVPSTDVQHRGVVGPGDEATHLYVSNTVVHTEERFTPQLGHGTGHQSHCHQGGAHTRTWGGQRGLLIQVRLCDIL